MIYTELHIHAKSLRAGYFVFALNFNKSSRFLLISWLLTVLKRVEESPVEDVDAMTTKSKPLTFQTMKSLPRPRQERKEDITVLLDPSAQKLMLEDAFKFEIKGLL